MAAKPKASGFQKFTKGAPPKKGGALPAKTAKPIKGKNRKGSK